MLDTNLVSELRKVQSGKADRHVANWEASVPPTAMFISVVTIMELELGALLMERRDRKQGRSLRDWLETRIIPAFANRTLPVDTAVARRCASLHVPDPQSERDALIAATALVHGMTVVTRNVADFQPSGVPVLNPWDA